MIRKGKCSIDYIESVMKDLVLANLSKPKYVKGEKKEKAVRVEIDGESIKALSDRYKLFFSKGYTCTECGITGSFFALERHLNDACYHLNLYAINDEGQEVLMTKDHIVPKSQGGKDALENYQTMCTLCNFEKGSII